MTQALSQALAAHTGDMSNRTHPSCHPSWHHGLKPRKDPNLLTPISQTLQRKGSGQGKVTLLLHQALSKLLGQPPSSITCPCSHTPVCAVLARCKVRGQNHPFEQPPLIHHVKLHPQHAQCAKSFLVWSQQCDTSRVPNQKRRQDVLGEKLVPREVVKGRGQGTQKAD